MDFIPGPIVGAFVRPKSFVEFPALSSLNIHDIMTQLRKPPAHMTSICFSVPGSKTSPILLKISWFSAQISGFSADFHRKSLDIVKQHPNNAEIWADSVF